MRFHLAAGLALAIPGLILLLIFRLTSPSWPFRKGLLYVGITLVWVGFMNIAGDVL